MVGEHWLVFQASQTKQCLSNVLKGNSIAYMSTVYNLRYGIKYGNVILTNPLNMIFLDR